MFVRQPNNASPVFRSIMPAGSLGGSPITMDRLAVFIVSRIRLRALVLKDAKISFSLGSRSMPRAFSFIVWT
jgi:hypothetical protein